MSIQDVLKLVYAFDILTCQWSFCSEKFYEPISELSIFEMRKINGGFKRWVGKSFKPPSHVRMSHQRQYIGEYAVLQDLGIGTTGKVKLAQHSTTGERVAIKIIKKAVFEKKPDMRKKVQREIALMRLLDHPHLLMLKEVCESPNHLYIVMEYAEHGELFDLITRMRSLPIEVAMRLFRQLIYGLEYLHSHAICHRDLKPENILLDGFDNIKVADFGFARWMRENIADTSCGSPHYAAPEVIRGVPYDGRAADIWSCGVILFALLAGRLPFCDSAIRVLLAKVKSGVYEMPDFPAEVQQLISGMLTVDTTQRITISQIKAHPAFRIGLPPAYILPTPLPLPVIADPVDPTTVGENVVGVLRQIGFVNDEELVAQFTAEGPTMAKVFYSKLTATLSLDNIPWSQPEVHESEGPDEPLMVAPRGMGFSNVVVDPFKAKKELMHIGSLNSLGDSVPEKAVWADLLSHEFKSDLVQPCCGIPLPMNVLMCRMQEMMIALNMEWFYPDDYTIIAKHPEDRMYLVMKIQHESLESMHMDLFFTQATAAFVQVIMESVRASLTPE